MATINASSVVDEILEQVLPVLRENVAEGERLRRLSDASIDALISAGTFLAAVPRELGGHELPPAETARMVEEIAKVDAGAGFVAGNCNSEAYTLLAFPEEGAREIFADPRAVIAGGAFPPAQAVEVPGGFKLTGQASFASGAHLATWVLAFGMIIDAGQPRLGPDGMPSMLMAMLRREDCELLDTWHTLGLRSSGSHDFRYTDVFVPASRAAPLALGEPNALFSGPLYRARLWGGHPAFAVTALGVARAAIDATTELAMRKTPNYMAQTVADNHAVQRLLGRSEGKWRAARAFVYETMDELWQHQLTGDFVTHEHAIDTQLACCFALESAREITEAVHEIAGTTGFREGGPLERLFRDAHTMSQHAFASAARYESVGKALLGRDIDWLFFQL
jgi:alkylation response protein AidB-like acyl-CoA dehydrogenase